MVRAFLRYGHLLKYINKTFFGLIPRKDNPENISHFRPINLCDVTHKIYRKIWTLDLN